MDRSTFQLFAPLTPAECAARLAPCVGEDRLFSFAAWSDGKPLVGRVTESSLRLRKRICYRNDFQPVLRATVNAVAGGTSISARCGLSLSVRISMSIWFGALIALNGPMLYATLTSIVAGNGGVRTGQWLGVGAVTLMLIFGVGLLVFGRHLARGEDRYLRDFIVQTLDAREHVG
jgi:hypothetical protein